MTSRPSETLAYHLHPTSCPKVEIYGDNGDFHNKAIGINRMCHTFGYIFVNSLFLII